MPVSQPIEAVETALYSALNVSSVKTLATGGVWPNVAGQGAALPFVVFQWQGGGDDNDHSTDSVNLVYTVKALASTALLAAQIVAAFDVLLHKQVLTVTGWINFWCRREEWVSFAEIDAVGKITFTRGAMYRIRIEKS